MQTTLHQAAAGHSTSLCREAVPATRRFLTELQLRGDNVLKCSTRTTSQDQVPLTAGLLTALLCSMISHCYLKLLLSFTTTTSLRSQVKIVCVDNML